MKKNCFFVIFFFAVVSVWAQTVNVAVFSLNDFHGGFLKDTRKDIPGAAAVWQTLDSLKAVYPHHLTVAAGDNFGGSYFYNATAGVPLPVLFEHLGIRLSAVGNHEFDDGQEELRRKWEGKRPKDWNMTYVCANVTDSAGIIPDYMQPTATAEITLSPTKRLKVGFLGLLTSNTPWQTSKRRIEGLKFNGNYTDVISHYKQEIADADIKLLLMHVGTRMDNGRPSWEDRDAANIASFSDNFFHAMLSGHSHEPVVGTINAGGYPVVQGKWHGEYISMVKFSIDTLTMQVVKVVPEIVPVNPDIVLDEKHRAFVNYTDSLLHVTTISGHALEEELTDCRDELIHDRADKFKQTRVGELVCEAYAEAVRRAGGFGKHDVIVGTSHFGSLRAGFAKGKLRVLDVGETLPFANPISVYRMSGRELMNLIEYGLHNEKYGWIQTSGLFIKANADRHVRKLTYICPDGKRVRLKKKKHYLVAADEFQALGGDGYGVPYFRPEQKVKVEGLPTTTEAFIRYLKEQPFVSADSYGNPELKK